MYSLTQAAKFKVKFDPAISSKADMLAAVWD